MGAAGWFPTKSRQAASGDIAADAHCDAGRYSPRMEILAPLIVGLALIWLIGRGVPWNAKLVTLAITLAVIVLIVALERGDYWPSALRR